MAAVVGSAACLGGRGGARMRDWSSAVGLENSAERRRLGGGGGSLDGWAFAGTGGGGVLDGVYLDGGRRGVSEIWCFDGGGASNTWSLGGSDGAS